jgi:hypothetical protein
MNQRLLYKMKQKGTIVLMLVVILTMAPSVNAQQYSFKKKFGNQKNAMYVYWGYNRSIYTKSDINFYSDTYDFTLKKAKATDRPTTKLENYFNPSKFTVPQFNARVGWYYKHRWDISIGYDHMKYVMQAGQSVYISGYVSETTTSQLNGTYSNLDGLIPIRDEDLHYENTNGLNYISLQLNNTKPLFKSNSRNFVIQRRLGIGAGPILTQTDFNWDGVEYHSGMSLSGFGLSLHTGIRFDFFNRFFFQSNWSGGYINLPKNPTIDDNISYAKHDFIYGQWELLGGVLFYIRTKNSCDTCPDWH